MERWKNASTIRELMVLFHRSTEDADNYLPARDNEEYLHIVMYISQSPLKEP